jgi:predicted AAA+ superfamily ATPase
MDISTNKITDRVKPLSFSEFLIAMGLERYVKLLQDGDFSLANTFSSTYIDMLKLYFFIGGMPEVVAAY